MALDRCNLCQSFDFTPVVALSEYLYVKCKRCGLVFLYPVPSDEVLHVYYAEREWAGGLPLEKNAGETYRPFLRLLRDLLRSRTASRPRLLEVGCSSGYFLEMALQDGYEVVGCDISSAAVQSAVKSLGPVVRLGTLFDMDLPGGSFDAVVMLTTIEHVKDPLGHFVEIYRILKPGGVLLITTGEIDSVEERLWKLFRLYGSLPCWYSAPEHLHCFSRKSIRNMLIRGGFTEIQVYTPFDTLFTVRGRHIFSGRNVFVVLANVSKLMIKVLAECIRPGTFQRNDYIMTVTARKLG